MIKQVYKRLSDRVSEARKYTDGPLTASENSLCSSLGE